MKKQIKILFIGNSFMYEMVKYLPKIISTNKEFLTKYDISITHLYVCSGRSHMFNYFFDHNFTSADYHKQVEKFYTCKETQPCPFVLYKYNSKSNKDSYIQDRNYNKTIKDLILSDSFDYIIINRHSAFQIIFEHTDFDLGNLQEYVNKIKDISSSKLIFVDTHGMNQSNILTNNLNVFKNYPIKSFEEQELELDKQMDIIKTFSQFYKIIDSRQFANYIAKTHKNKWFWRKDWSHMAEGGISFCMNLFMIKSLISSFDISKTKFTIDVSKYKKDIEDDPTISVTDKNRNFFVDIVNDYFLLKEDNHII